jgi:hypothetical protein
LEGTSSISQSSEWNNRDFFETGLPDSISINRVDGTIFSTEKGKIAVRLDFDHTKRTQCPENTADLHASIYKVQ